MLSLIYSDECDKQVESPSSQSFLNSVQHPSKDTSDRS